MPHAGANVRADAPVILVLAAGEGRRFSGIKQLSDINGQPMLRRVVWTALQTALPVIVVLGAHADTIAPVLADLSIQVIRHAEWLEGMGGSLAAGMRQLQITYPDASAVMVLLGDQPLIDSATLERMLKEHVAAPRQILASEQVKGVGPPALFPRDCFAALADCTGDQGARALLKAQAHRVVLQRHADTTDVDTSLDLVRVQASISRLD
jgi:CTP:molybdopterin cytidylyltransferase MocA